MSVLGHGALNRQAITSITWAGSPAQERLGFAEVAQLMSEDSEGDCEIY